MIPWNYLGCDPEPVEPDMPDPDFDPAKELVDIIIVDTVITNNGQVKQLAIYIYADGHEEGREYFLEDTCQPPPYWIPF